MGIVRPHLWYHSRATEAARFYVSVFPNSRILKEVAAPPGTPGVEEGAGFIVEFMLDGMPVAAISAGPVFTLDESFSFIVDCTDQAEVDHYWEVLAADGGRHSMCGWLVDRFGLSWQVVPTELDTLLSPDPDPAAAARAAAALYTMTKIDLAALRAAYAAPA